jgi:hypothetical protein
MAIPATAFGASVGIALMRQNPSTSEWFFVDWVRGSADFVLDTPGVGTWIYAHWYVVGNPAQVDVTGFTIQASRGSLLATDYRR